MTFKIEDGDGVFFCDECAEHIECDGCGDDFRDSLTYARQNGWRTYKGPDKEFAHSCPACVEEWATARR